MNEIILVNNSGEVLASSREVAEKFGKRHTHVLDIIKGFSEELSTTEFSVLFKESFYVALNGKKNIEYLMNRDGFSLIAMGFTGRKALAWKIKYIKAFNMMEEKLKSSNYLSEKEKLKLQLFSKDALEVATAHNKLVEIEVEEATRPLLITIEEQKPLVDFANHVTETSDTVDVGEFAKLVKNENIDIGRNRLFEWLRKNKYLMDNNIPYQQYIERKWFEVIETVKQTAYGSKIFTKTLITGKGQVALVEKLRKEYEVIV